MSSDGEEVSAMAHGLQLAGCGIFLVEQFSGISAVMKPIPRNNKAPTFLWRLRFVWCGIRSRTFA